MSASSYRRAEAKDPVLLVREVVNPACHFECPCIRTRGYRCELVDLRQGRLSGAAIFAAFNGAQTDVRNELALPTAADPSKATLGSVVLSTNTLLNNQKQYFETKLGDAVAAITRAMREFRSRSVEWVSTHSWRPRPKFTALSPQASGESARKALTVIVPAAAAGTVGSVCDNIMVVANIPAKNGESFHALNGLCGDHAGTSSNFSCVASGRKEDKSVVVHGIVATVGPLAAVEGKSECKGQILLDESVIPMLDLSKQNVQVLLGVNPQGMRTHAAP